MSFNKMAKRVKLAKFNYVQGVPNGIISVKYLFREDLNHLKNSDLNVMKN